MFTDSCKESIICTYISLVTIFVLFLPYSAEKW